MRRASVVLLALAGLLALALLVAASTIPAYSGESVTSAGVVTHDSKTLVGENGTKVLVPLGLPLVAVLVVAADLRARRRRGRPGPGIASSVALVLLLLLVLAAALSVGPLLLPLYGLVVVAVGLEGADRRAARVPPPPPPPPPPAGLSPPARWGGPAPR